MAELCLHSHRIKPLGKLIGIDALDQQARIVRLAHAQQQPGPLGDPIGAVNIGWRIGLRERARRARMLAQRDRKVRVSPA